CPRRDCEHLRPPICPATFRKLPSRPCGERPAKFRGARTEVLGKISHTANSALVRWARDARGDRLELPDWLCPRSALRDARSTKEEQVLMDTRSDRWIVSIRSAIALSKEAAGIPQKKSKNRP